MRRTTGAVFFLVTIFAIAGAFSTFGGAVAPDATLLSLFPQDSIGIIFVNVAELRDNEWIRGWVLDRTRTQLGERADRFSRLTGVDPFTAVDQVMLGRTGDGEFLGVARVDYDPLKLEQRFQDRGVGQEVYQGRTIYLPQTDDDWSLAFVDDIVLMGGRATIRKAIDQAEGSAPSVLENTRLLEGIQSIEDGNQVWGVGWPTSGLFSEQFVPPLAVDLVRSLETITYQMRLDTALTARAVGEFATPEAARRTGDLLRGVVALGRMQAIETEDLLLLIDGIRIDDVESAIEIHFTADGDLLRRISENDFAFPAPALRGDE